MVNGTRLGRLALFGTLVVAAATATAQVGAQAISPNLYADLTWRCVGPFDGGPVASVAGVAGEAGVYLITTPSGGAWKTIDGGDTWASLERQRVAAVVPDPHRWTDPANPRRIVRTEAQGIAVSLDGGETWVASHNMPIAEVAHLTPRSLKPEAIAPPRSIAGQPVNVSIADPTLAGLIFAGTSDSVYVSFDNGVRWESLQLNLPSVSINDLDIRGGNLVAATQGRSVWELDDITPLRQLGAATASAAAMLFKPADAVVIKPDSAIEAPAAGVNLDYYLGASSNGEVKLEVLDLAGRVIHAATSKSADAADRWLPVTRPLAAAPGHHRVVWNLRLDPPPARTHQYAHMAPAVFEDMPADPDGPVVLPGSYSVKLTVAGKTYAQPLIVHNDPSAGEAPATLRALRQQFDLEMKVYDAMRTAYREFLQLTRVRAQLRPLLTSADPAVALAAADLDARLNDLDGSDWTGLVVPDADDEVGDVDEKEGKHPDFVPPKPVSISKDYDDPTSILGRTFANVDHAPAFAIVSVALGGMLAKTAAGRAAPDAAAVADYERSCQQLSAVLDGWRTINRQDLPRMNADLAARKLPPLPVAASVTSVVCSSR